MAEFEPLVFEIRQGANDASKGVDQLVASLGKLKSVTGKMSALSSTVRQLKRLNEELKGFQQVDKVVKLADALNSLSKISQIKIPTGFYKNLAGIAGATTILTDEGVSRFERLAAALREVGQVGNIRIPNVGVRTAPEPKLPISPKSSGIGNSEAMTEARSRIDAVRSSVAEARSQVEMMRASTAEALRQSEAFGQILQGVVQAAQIVSSVIRLIVSVVKVLITVLKKVVAVIKTVVTQIKRLAVSVGKVLLRPFTNLASKINKAFAGVKQFFNSISRIAMYRLIRSAIAALTQGLQEGMENLYKYSKLVGTDFADAMDRIATDALYVKNSLAAMVSPIIEALAPAVDYLTDKFVDLLNTVNLFISRLLGKDTYTVARKVASVWQEIGDNTDEATKKLKSYTIGIDELNIIEEPSRTRDLSGTPDEDYSKWFRELPTEDNWITDFADRLRQAFENGDWKKLGTLLGEKVNEAIDAVNWKGIGNTVGYYLDGVIKTAYYFLKEIDFAKAGKSVADLLNSLLEAVDWEFVGRFLVVKITSVWDFAIGFLKGLDWGEVGHSIFSFIIGALKEFDEWLDEIDWIDLGKTLLRKIKDFFENFDFKEVIRTISTVLGKTMKAMKDLLTPLWESFKGWWDEHIKGKDFLETMKNLGEYLVKFVDEYVLTPFFKAFAGTGKKGGSIDLSNINFERQGVGDLIESIIGDPNLSGMDKLKYMGQSMVAGILYGIHEMIKDKWLLSFLVEPFLGLIARLFGIHSPATTMMPIGENLTLGILQGMQSQLQAIKTFCDGLIDMVQGILSAGATLVITAIDAASMVINAIGDALARIINAGANLIITAIDQASTVIAGVGNALNQIITAGSTLIITAIDQATAVIEAVGRALTSIIGATATVIIKALDMASAVIQAVSNALITIIGKVVTIMITAIDQASAIINAVGNALQSIAGATATLIITAIDTATSVIRTVERAFRSIAGATTTLTITAVESVTSVISSIGAGLSNLVTAASSAGSQVISALGSALSSGINSISSIASSIGGAIANGISTKSAVKNIEKINAALNEITRSISVAVSVNTSEALASISALNNALSSIPRSITVTVSVRVVGGGNLEIGGTRLGITPHAKGGIFDRPTYLSAGGSTQLFGEAGREAVLPLDSYTGWMDDVANRVKDTLGEDSDGYSSFERALDQYYAKYWENNMYNLVESAQRQADKSESTIVRIGQKSLYDSVEKQEKANGYKFVR